MTLVEGFLEEFHVSPIQIFICWIKYLISERFISNITAMSDRSLRVSAEKKRIAS